MDAFNLKEGTDVRSLSRSSYMVGRFNLGVQTQVIMSRFDYRTIYEMQC